MKRSVSFLVLPALLFLILFPGTTYGATLYVGPGETYTEIQPAIDAAVDGVDIVVVRDGTYTGANNKNLDFGGKAITLRSENGPEHCIIDCQGNGRGFYFHLNESVDSIVDGFTVTNGAVSGAYPLDTGGGILCDRSSPTITNCNITENFAARHGGGIAVSFCEPVVVNSTITENSSDYHGGGIVLQFSNARIENCIIDGNSTRYDGGGIYCWHTSPNITNSIISRNVAGNKGGGIHCCYTSAPPIVNCTITENSADIGGGISCFTDVSPMLTNCILWGNNATAGPEISLQTGTTSFPTLTVNYCDIEGGQEAVYIEPGGNLNWGVGNISANPLFVGEGDYHLAAGSLCIDTGTDAGIYTDIDGDSRPQGDGYDMGADEHTQNGGQCISQYTETFSARMNRRANEFTVGDMWTYGSLTITLQRPYPEFPHIGEVEVWLHSNYYVPGMASGFGGIRRTYADFEIGNVEVRIHEDAGGESREHKIANELRIFTTHSGESDWRDESFDPCSTGFMRPITGLIFAPFPYTGNIADFAEAAVNCYYLYFLVPPAIGPGGPFYEPTKYDYISAKWDLSNRTDITGGGSVIDKKITIPVHLETEASIPIDIFIGFEAEVRGSYEGYHRASLIVPLEMPPQSCVNP